MKKFKTILVLSLLTLTQLGFSETTEGDGGPSNSTRTLSEFCMIAQNINIKIKGRSTFYTIDGIEMLSINTGRSVSLKIRRKGYIASYNDRFIELAKLTMITRKEKQLCAQYVDQNKNGKFDINEIVSLKI